MTAAPTVIVLNGRASEDETLTYLNLPFDVPAGTARIDVRYEYSAAIGSDPHLTGGNTVDIGIFDPRGADFMTQGFRGWSGSARASFFVATDNATPGYLPGPIQAGMWFVCLGLYKVAPDGCEYTVTITLTPAADSAAPGEFAPRLALSASPRPDVQKADGWYRGELHCHTVHSDGDSDPYELVTMSEALGLDFLAITDHNNITHLAALNDIDTSLMLIPGYEVTTYKGHWNIWGGQGWIDFRILSPERMAEAIQAARAAGYLVSCNHPRPYGPPWEYEQVEGYQCVEVWNGPWPLFNQTALDFWEARLRAGHRLVAVGGSDAHFLHREHIARIGQPTMWIHCDGAPSPAKLLDNLRAGHAFISATPDGPRLTLRVGDAIMGDSIPRPSDDRVTLHVSARGADGLQMQVHGASGYMAHFDVDGDDCAWEVPVSTQGTPYLRAQLVEPDANLVNVHALTNPIYIG